MFSTSPPLSPVPATGPDIHDPRPDEVERAYFARRAQDHRRLAETAGDDGTRALHLRFAKAYQDRITMPLLVQQD